MKNIILSADGDSVIYSVPDAVADNLKNYCLDFSKWIYNSPDAKKYRMGRGDCFSESDFIDYLNQYVFPNEQSTFVKNIGWTDGGRKLPYEYKDYPKFCF